MGLTHIPRKADEVPTTNLLSEERTCGVTNGQMEESQNISLQRWVPRDSPLLYAVTAAKSLQSCPTLYDPIDGSPPGFPVPGILQARTLEWVAISFSNAWKWKVKVKSLSRVQLPATPWTAAYQAPPSMGFSRQEHWSGCHCLLRCMLLLLYNCKSTKLGRLARQMERGKTLVKSLHLSQPWFFHK